MKATIPTKDLREALTRTKDSLGARHRLLVLEGVKVTAADGAVTLTTTNLELTTEATVLGARGHDDGEALIPHAALAKLAGKLDGDDTELVTDDDGRVRVRSADADVSLRLMPIEDYPQTPKRAKGRGDDLTGIMGLVFKLAGCAVAASNDYELSRNPVLGGVVFEPGRVWATDKYRLAWVDRPGELDANVPAEAVQAVRRAKVKRLRAWSDGERVTFVGEVDGRFRYTWHTRSIEGRRLDTAQVIPAECAGTFEVDRAKLDRVIDRIAAVGATNTTATPVTLAASDGGLTVSAGSGEVGEASETIPCEVTGEVPSMIAFNPRYLRDGLATFDSDRVRASLRDELKPVVFRPVVMGEESTEVGYLQMPVRL